MPALLLLQMNFRSCFILQDFCTTSASFRKGFNCWDEQIKTQFIAHRRKKDGESQYLCNHLTRVSVLTEQFAAKIGLKEAGRVIGLLHDMGKASDEFNKYIKSATGLIDPDADDYVEAKEQRGKIDHSTAGAQEIYKILSQKGPGGIIAAQVLSLCIASHHSGLIDCLLPSGEDNFTRRINKSEEKTHTDEALSCLDDNVASRVGAWIET